MLMAERLVEVDLLDEYDLVVDGNNDPNRDWRKTRPESEVWKKQGSGRRSPT